MREKILTYMLMNSQVFYPYKIIDFRAHVDDINRHLADMGLDNLFESNVGMAIFINLCEEARNLTKTGPHKTRTLKIVLAVSLPLNSGSQTPAQHLVIIFCDEL